MAEGLPPTEAALRRRRRQRRRAAILAQLVGKDSLPEDQQCTLEVAKIICKDVFQQNGLTDNGFMCPLAKMKAIVGLHEAALKSTPEFVCDQEVGWNTIATTCRSGSR